LREGQRYAHAGGIGQEQSRLTHFVHDVDFVADAGPFQARADGVEIVDVEGG
jgi:hypothetical protein